MGEVKGGKKKRNKNKKNGGERNAAKKQNKNTEEQQEDKKSEKKNANKRNKNRNKNRKKKNKLMFIDISLYSLIILHLFISVYLFHNLYFKSLFTTQKAFFNKIFIFFIKNGCAFLFYLRYK